MSLTVDRLLREKIIDELAELYPDDSSSRGLLLRMGAPQRRLPSMGVQRPIDHWIAVCLQVARGAFRFTLQDLVDTAAADHPSNSRLRRFAGDVTAVDGDGATGRIATLTVLMLLAAPTDLARLRLDVEHRTIEEVARREGRIAVNVSPAVRPTDILPALLREKPDVVHFSGHGGQDGTLAFEDERGRTTTVAPAALAGLFTAVGGLTCVVLNSCFTGAYAQVFLRSAGAVAGCRRPLEDAGAIAFTRGFYAGLGHGRTTERAYRLGLAEMDIAGCDTAHMTYLAQGDLP